MNGHAQSVFEFADRHGISMENYVHTRARARVPYELKMKSGRSVVVGGGEAWRHWDVLSAEINIWLRGDGERMVVKYKGDEVKPITHSAQRGGRERRWWWWWSMRFVFIIWGLTIGRRTGQTVKSKISLFLSRISGPYKLLGRGIASFFLFLFLYFAHAAYVPRRFSNDFRFFRVFFLYIHLQTQRTWLF